MINARDQLEELRWRLLESDGVLSVPFFPSGFWSATEVAGYFTQRQNRFNRDTKLLLAHQPLTVTAGQAQIAAPDDWIATLNASWIDAPTGTSTTVAVGDRFAAERAISATNNPPLRPVIVDDNSAGPLLFECYPPPLTDGQLDLLYACVLEAITLEEITPQSNPESDFDLPDDFVVFVTYGVLADMLAKDGRGRDLARAAYCESRYQEGVRIAALLLEGYV